MQDARRRRNLPVRRRHEGITAAQLVEADTCIALGLSFLVYGLAPFEEDEKLVFLTVGSALTWIGADILSWVPSQLDPINPANKDRGIESFSDECCYRELRFTKAQLLTLTLELNLPYHREELRDEANITMCIFAFSDLVEYIYHYCGHRYDFWWSIHKHHHHFYNPSPFAVIADDWPDQFMRTLPMIMLPSLLPINMDLLFFCFASLFYGYGVYLHSGYESRSISAHNPIFNTSYHHYHHHAISTKNKPICTGFFFKIWDQLFGTEDDKEKCSCYVCRPAKDRSFAVWEKTLKPDYGVLLNVSWWLNTSIDVSE